MRISLNNKARVILFARRDIKKDEILFYDYNAGDLKEYPTDFGTIGN